MKVRATQSGMSVRLLINGQPVFVTQTRVIDVDMENKEVAQQVRYMMEMGWLEEVKEEQVKRTKVVRKEERRDSVEG